METMGKEQGPPSLMLLGLHAQRPKPHSLQFGPIWFWTPLVEFDEGIDRNPVVNCRESLVIYAYITCDQASWFARWMGQEPDLLGGTGRITLLRQTLCRSTASFGHIFETLPQIIKCLSPRGCYMP